MRNIRHKKLLMSAILLVGAFFFFGFAFKDPAPPVLRAMYPYFHIEKLEGDDHYTFGNYNGFEFDFYAKEMMIGDRPFYVVAENNPSGTSRYMFLGITLDPQLLVEIAKAPKVASAHDAFEGNIFHVDITGDGKTETFIRTVSDPGYLTYTIIKEEDGNLKEIDIQANFEEWTNVKYVGFQDGAVLLTHGPEGEYDESVHGRHFVVGDELLTEEEVERRAQKEAFRADLAAALDVPEWAPLARAFDEECELLTEGVLNAEGRTFTEMVRSLKPAKILPDGAKVFIVPCMLHAYQTSQMPALLDKGVYTPLEVTTLGEEGERYTSYRAVEFGYDPVTDRFSTYGKGRGQGDCGSGGEYALVDKKLVLQKFEADWECDGEYERKVIFP